MDLPTCPSCGQSVLEDDATDCPFCGASMSGKPAAKPSAPSKPAGGSPPPVRKKQQEGSAAPPVRRGSGGAAVAAEDGPIEADEEARAKAIPVRLKKVKGLVLRVKCPMCESEGWVPAKAAGRDVRCANKQCLVPIFTAPELPKKEEEKPQEKKSLPWAYIAAGVLVVGGGIGAFVYFGNQDSPDQVGGGYKFDPIEECDTPECKDDDGPSDPKPVERVKIAEIRAKVFEEMQALAPGAARVAKPLARQRTAVAHARFDDVDEARQQIEYLQGAVLHQPFFDVDALAEIGWTNLRHGRDTKDEADKLAELDKSPFSGREVTLGFANRAAFLHAAGRSDVADAAAVPNDEHARGALLQRLAESSRSFDADFEMDHAPFLAPVDRGSQMVTVQLADRGRWDEAVRYADGSLQGADRIENLVLIAELLAARYPEGADERIAKVVGLLGNGPEAALAHARVAMRHLSNDRPEPAKAALASAVALLPAKPPEPAKLPGAKAVYEKTYRYDRPFTTLAAAEVARVTAIEATLSEGETTSAWTAYQRALLLASGEAPPVSVTDRMVADADRPTREVVDALMRELNIATEKAAIDGPLPDYRINLKDVDRAARAVLAIRRAILIDAARRGMAIDVWNLVSDNAAGEPADRFTRSPLIHVLAEELEGDARKSIADLVPEKPSAIEVGLVSPETVVAIDPDAVGLGKKIGDLGGAEADLVFVRLASYLEREKGRETAIAFVMGNDRDHVVRADALRLVEARAASETEPELAWKQLLATNQLEGLDFIAAAEGLLLATETVIDEPAPQPADDNPATASNN